MAQLRPGREVVVAGVGLHPFGRFPDKDLSDLALEAAVESLKDAGVRWKDIPIAYFGHVYYQGMSLGETTLSKLGLTGVPIVNVENACSSGSTAFWQAYWGITTGIYDMALAFGAEKVPRGPVTVTAEDAPERYIGGDHMMAGYALRARRYMEDQWGARDSSGPGFRESEAERSTQPLRPPQGHLFAGGGASVPDDLRPSDPLPVLPHQRGCRRNCAVRPRVSWPVRHRRESCGLHCRGSSDLRRVQRPRRRPLRLQSLPHRARRPAGLRNERPWAGGRRPVPGARMPPASGSCSRSSRCTSSHSAKLGWPR